MPLILGLGSDTARRGSYRILYFIDVAEIVEVTAIRHRADAYRT
jgi:mRNA-degrading endonuclease RelE of RelBE toxin-antitoxin system